MPDEVAGRHTHADGSDHAGSSCGGCPAERDASANTPPDPSPIDSDPDGDNGFRYSGRVWPEGDGS